MKPYLSEEDRHNQIQVEIKNKIAQLRSVGLKLEDLPILRKRLAFVWREPDNVPDAPATRSRFFKSRNIFRMVQETSSHLFLAVLLVVTPTVCASPAFLRALNQLMDVHDHGGFVFKLGAKDRGFFESTAAEQGFAMVKFYLDFMESMFSEPEPRQIQLAYSLVPRDSIEAFLKEILEGVFTSEQWAKEEVDGGNTTGCATIFIPSDQGQDGSCTIRVNRTKLVHSIHNFNMTKLKLE